MADWGYAEINDAVILTPGNYESFLREYEEVLVYYYLPDCKYCKVMDEFFNELALEWKERDTRIPFAKFDCSRHLDFCEDHAIPIFPYIKFYIKGHPLVYSGERTQAALDEYIEDILEKTPHKKNL